MRKKQYRSFESARKFVRQLKFKKNKDWREYCKSHNNPYDIPANPNRNYKKEWKGWGDFLGTKNMSSKDKGKQMKSFKDARKSVRELDLQSDHEWKQYCNSGNKPVNIPTNPHTFYKNEWNGLSDWLGTGTVATQDRTYLPFKEAREFVRDLHLTGQKNWREYCTLHNNLTNIHTNPNTFYKNKGWVDWGDFLGTGTVATHLRPYLPFKEARKIVHKLKLKNNVEWQKYCTSGNKPVTIPSNPERRYKDYIDSGDWLGTGTIDNRKRSKSFLSAKEAKTILKKLFKEYGIKNLSDWNTFTSDHKKLLEELHIPLDLLHFYSKENAKKREKQK